MKKIYEKPDCEVMEFDTCPLMIGISRITGDTAAADSGANMDLPEAGDNNGTGNVPECSKGSSPWSDDFEFHID